MRKPNTKSTPAVGRRQQRMVRPLRERNITELNTAALTNKCLACGSGVLAAANLASSMYNGVSAHKSDLGDCLLAKLNLLRPDLKVRRNPYWPNE